MWHFPRSFLHNKNELRSSLIELHVLFSYNSVVLFLFSFSLNPTENSYCDEIMMWGIKKSNFHQKGKYIMYVNGVMVESNSENIANKSRIGVCHKTVVIHDRIDSKHWQRWILIYGKQNHNIMPWKIWTHALSSPTCGSSGIANGRDWEPTSCVAGENSLLEAPKLLMVERVLRNEELGPALFVRFCLVWSAEVGTNSRGSSCGWHEA
jgi:hypothetical protein